MKFNFRKVASVLATAVMLGSTAGFALAANYPSPLVVNGVSNAVIVTGANAPLDITAATAIQSDLDDKTTAITDPISVDGESVKIEKGKNLFNIGETADSFFTSSVTETHLPILLADGVLRGDDKKDYKYTQKITLNNSLELEHFQDSDYEDDVPALGFELSSDAKVLVYTLTFGSTKPNITDGGVVQFEEIEMLGKKYFISEASSGATPKLTLLDSSASEVIDEGETKTLTVDGVDYTITPVGFTEFDLRLSINGQTTSALVKGDVYKIADDVYLGVKDYIPVQVERDARMVEVVIGNGKIELENGKVVKIGEKNVKELKANVAVVNTDELSSIAINWTTTDEEFIGEDNKLAMPGFGSVNLVMAGMTFPEPEEITVQGDSSGRVILTAPIKDGSVSLNLLYANQTSENFTGIGRSATDKLVTSNSTKLTFNETAKDEKFVVSWASGDESESYVLGASVSENEDETQVVTLTNILTGEDICEEVAKDEECDVSENIALKVDYVNSTLSTNKTAVFSGTGISFNTLYTEKGLKVYLPCDSLIEEIGAINLTNSTQLGSYTLVFQEANTETDAIGDGKFLNLTLDVQGGSSSNKKTQVSSVDANSLFGKKLLRIGESDDYEGYVNSSFSTKVLHKTGGDQDSAIVTYYGDEVYGNVFLASSAAVTSTTSKVQMIKDTDTIPTNKNLVVVGGSCINSLAAKIMGVPAGTCGDNQDVIAKDKYIVKVVAASSVVDGAQAGKVAILVAGWEAADTQKAANKLLEGISTSVDTLVEGPAVGA